MFIPSKMRSFFKFVLCITFCLQTFHGGSDASCEDSGWSSFKDEKCVKLLPPDKYVDYAEAKRICAVEEIGAEVIRINSIEEQQFVANLIFEVNGVVDDVWLGAIRKMNSKTDFFWDDSLQSELRFSYWAEGSPSENFEQNCTKLVYLLSNLDDENQPMRLVKAVQEHGQWTDVLCSKRNLVLCQKNQDWSIGDMQTALLDLRLHFRELQANHDALQIAHDELRVEFDALAEISLPKNCQQTNGAMTTVTIYPLGKSQPIKVRCDFETDGGGWTIIQTRNAGPLEEFAFNWSDYEEGFGSVNKNYWIGLKVMNALTSTSAAVPQELRIELEDWEGNQVYAKYSSFSVGTSSNLYRLEIGGYSGTAGDSMDWHNGMNFTTQDRDNDLHPDGNCADLRHGGWWFNRCAEANLNGFYRSGADNNGGLFDGINWFHWKGLDYSLKRVEMKIRDFSN